MGSTRLPGKVLMTLAGKTILETLVERISSSKLVDKMIIATTTNVEDDAIVDLCDKKKIAVSRGSEWDVLDRFYQCAKNEQPDNVIRVTSDCPLHSYKVVDFVIREFLASGKDYFSNSNNEPDFLEDGFDTEVFSFHALEVAWKNAKLLSEREHVTPYIKNSGLFKCGWKKSHPAYHYKLSVDSAEDLKVVTSIFHELKDRPDFGIDEVVELLKRKPELLEMNKNSVINSGYQKSLDNDREI
jgi:spore coat polysaccharide biosynthesis protein SpsF (cytidylyltransferase family)